MSVQFAGYKSYVPMVLFAVDEIGMVASDEQRPGRKKAYPWSAVASIRPEIE